MTLYIVRHGQCRDGAAGILNGLRNEPLTDLGIDQAQRAARIVGEIVGEREVKLHSSDLLRAAQTAECIRHYLGLDAFEQSELLRERDLGVFTGKTGKQALAIVDPRDVIHTHHTKFAEHPKYGCETFREVDARMGQFVTAALSEQVIDTAVVVAMHGDSGRALAGAALGMGMREMLGFPFGNGDVIEVDASAGSYEVYANSLAA